MRTLGHAGATFAWVGLGIGALVVTAPTAAPQVSTGETCASAIMADLDAYAEGWQVGDLQVPSPKYDWVLDACNGQTSTPGVYGSITAYEDGSYTIIGYGDRWDGCVLGGACAQ